MSARIRLSLAAAIVPVSALGGAAYAEPRRRRRSGRRHRSPTLDFECNSLGARGRDADRRVIDRPTNRSSTPTTSRSTQQLLIDGETQRAQRISQAEESRRPADPRRHGDRRSSRTILPLIEKRRDAHVATRYPTVANQRRSSRRSQSAACSAASAIRTRPILSARRNSLARRAAQGRKFRRHRRLHRSGSARRARSWSNRSRAIPAIQARD